ncbi:MAG: ribonucleoside-diphosphate reductase subunit alpha [Patescibacteria group bacterium]
MYPTLREIRKRTGQVVPFEAEKITRAIEKAFECTLGDDHKTDTEAIANIVLKDLEVRIRTVGESYVPAVEEVQDLVERAIMQKGFFTVAKAYIVYRYEHQKIREQKKEVLQKRIAKKEFLIKKLDGRTETFSLEKIEKAFLRSARGIEKDIDIKMLLEQSQREVYEGMTTRDISQMLVLVARSFIERDSAYTLLASRLLLETTVYRDAIGYTEVLSPEFAGQYREAFIQNTHRGIELNLLDGRLASFDLRKIADAIAPERDDLLRYLGTQTLFDRYFVRDKTNPNNYRILEAPQMMWMRVAMGLSLLEEKKEERAIEFYNLMSTLRYVPSTPTLFNAGTPYSQLSSCYLGVTGDDLHSIFKAYEDYSHLAKHSGGIGYSWTKLRATGARVKSTGVESNGVVPFLKILDSTVVAINRSGRRRGACAVYLEPWHADVEEFIELRKNTGDERRRTPDINTALWIPDEFMKRVRDDREWTLFSPDETPDLVDLYGAAFSKRYAEYEARAEKGEMRLSRRMQARDLWKKMLTQLFETGHPWVTFKDASNIRSPQDHMGTIHSSNLCTEITLNTSADDEVAVCNLGSINLTEHVVNGTLSEDLIQETTVLAVRMLDNVIDLNYYPIPETKKSNMRHRPIGLGIMGFQDALYLQNIPFESKECITFADESMEMISYYAILASSLLAQERGAYETYEGSKWHRGIFPVDTLDLLEKDRGEKITLPRTERMDWSIVRDSVKKYGMRNSNCLAMAPTATIANIAGCFPTIEPIYKNIYVKSNISGEFILVNEYLVRDLKKEGLWNSEMLEILKGVDGDLSRVSSVPSWIKERHREVFAIDPQFLVTAAAHRGQWIDQSQSLNIFFSGTSGSQLSDVYLSAWQQGIKTTYYLRTLAASGVEKSTVTLEKQNLAPEVRERLIAQEAVDSIKSTIVPEESVPVHATSSGPALKLCKIDDPDCQACQ